MHCSLPGSFVHGIFQIRIWEWAAISMPLDLPNPGIKPMTLASAGRFFTTRPPGKPKSHNNFWVTKYTFCASILLS